MFYVEFGVRQLSKHRRKWNESIYEKYIRDGRGCGCGSDYKPWIYIQDFASRGIVSRVKGKTTGRVHHLMSNNELAYFYILDWSDKVTDIREQYPLLNLEKAVRIAEEAGIKYPVDNISGYPYVLTCDFMITTIAGIKARTIKISTELENPRVLEKLEIERRYWQEQDVDWKIVTEREISYRKAKNIEWLYTAYYSNVADESCCILKQAQDAMQQKLMDNTKSVIEVSQIIENEFHLRAGTGLQLFKQLVLSKAVTVNLNKRLNLNVKGIVAWA